jgi:hypothetical protein
VDCGGGIIHQIQKRIAAILIIIALIIAASAMVFQFRTRQIPFDTAAWRSGDAKLRFRMKDSLEAKYRAGKLPTREVVDRLLGPDDNGMDTPEVRGFNLMEWDGNPWYLRVRLDEQGKVNDFRAQAS